VDEPFLTNVYNEVLYQVKRLQSHPSVALWSGNNENEAALAQNWYRVPADKMPKAKDDYRKLYVGTVMRAVQEVDKGNNRPFITSSPTNGLESIREDYIATNPQDPLYGEFIHESFLYMRFQRFFLGDVHFYGFNNDSWNATTYPITRFLSETGMISLPSLDTWLEVTRNATDLQYHSAFVAHREHDTKVYREPYVNRSCSSIYS
jgi:beta-mannosidase